VAVSDSGPGIGAEDQERLFRPFERGGAPGLRGEAGFGLGLYISRSLVELHGGRLWVESAPGAGSSFFATFPAASR
jgi:signal transduction histidine kinase